MTHISIELSDEEFAKLQHLAAVAGLSISDFLKRWIERLLDPPDDAFREAAVYVLKKNDELYQRLA